MPRAGLALGSNLGDRLAHLRAAVTCLREISTPGEPVLLAHVYQTEPRCCPPGSPDFHNSVIEIDFQGTPYELLEKTRGIELQLGRSRNVPRNAPRIIDIDLLYLGDSRVRDDMLILPHPRIGQRRFVLQPLADIRPDLVLPAQILTIAGLLEQLIPGEAPPVRLPASL
ncbi:MAG: 2-amino-4-hydroxy-6-hydroxymethyldihydropteridine diphosphokinase [Verrucomicrobia bacterium]|nr:2-amino-4-hydroxy-6-hydroxymethyldihydropteridine diphosphokinase [Verrucomicrobiota bacterium]